MQVLRALDVMVKKREIEYFGDQPPCVLAAPAPGGRQANHRMTGTPSKSHLKGEQKHFCIFSYEFSHRFPALGLQMFAGGA